MRLIPDNADIFASSDRKGTIYTWDARTSGHQKRPSNTINLGGGRSVPALVFLDDWTFASGDSDGCGSHTNVY